MCIFVLPSSINLAAKNDHYIYTERESERKEEREKNKLVRSGSISVDYGTS